MMFAVSDVRFCSWRV